MPIALPVVNVNNPMTNAPTGRVGRNWIKSGGKAPAWVFVVE